MDAEQESQSILDQIDNAVEEIETRREREQARHEREMEKIEETEEQINDEMYEDGGLTVLEDQHKELAGLRQEIRDRRKQTVKCIYKAISAHLSGGYDETITVKKGRVYRFNKKRNARLDFYQLVSGYHRSALESGLHEDAPSEVADAVITALDMIGEKTNDGRLPTFTATSDDISITRMDDSGYRTRERHYTNLEVKYKTDYTGKKDHYASFMTDEEFNPNKFLSEVTSRDPEDMKMLIQARDEIFQLMASVEDDMRDSKEAWEAVWEHVGEELPEP